MKSFEELSIEEAIGRLKNFLMMNFKFSVQEIDDKLTCLRLTHGEERLSDLAYFVQYAFIERAEFMDILQTVYHDLMLFNKQHVPFRTFSYTGAYQIKVTMKNLPKRKNLLTHNHRSYATAN